MENIKHIQPEKQYEKEGVYTHKFELEVDGENVGFAELVYKNSPFPFYYLSELFIFPDKRGKGWGKSLLLNFNKFLDQKGKTGILLNVILSKDKAICDLYKNNGWEQSSKFPALFTYNLPSELSKGSVERALKEIVESNW